MAKQGRGPYPVPDGYVQLPEAHARFLGPPPSMFDPDVSDELRAVWDRKVRALWVDVHAAILQGDIVCHGVIPGSLFGVLPVAFWHTLNKRLEYPPGAVDFWISKVEPLLKEEDMQKIADLWAQNQLNDEAVAASDANGQPRDEEASAADGGVETPGQKPQFSGGKLKAEAERVMAAMVSGEHPRLSREQFVARMRETFPSVTVTAARSEWKRLRPHDWSKSGPRGPRNRAANSADNCAE